MNPEVYMGTPSGNHSSTVIATDKLYPSGKMITFRHACFLCFLILTQLTKAQYVRQGEDPVDHIMDQGPITLPFRMVSNLIILPVQINDSDTLQFIFDTGLENSTICELEADEVLELKQAREVLVREIGHNNPAHAIQSRGNSLKIGDISIEDQEYLILTRNVLQLSSKMGTKIHGLINMQAFQEYMIEIDYERKLLTIYEPGYFNEHKNLDGYASLQMEINNTTPCIHTTIFTKDGASRPVKLMLDTGAGYALSLNTGSLQGFTIPETSRDCFIGYSIDGNIEGKIGRIKGMDIGPYNLPDLLVSFPDSQAVSSEGTIQVQNGIIGSELLRRFNLIFDYPDKKIHIIANNAFRDKYQYNISGLDIRMPVPGEHRYIIAGIRGQSRAEGAGIMPGDEILSINGTPASLLSLDEIYKSLQGNHGKKIRMELLREDKRIQANFRLEKYI
jgi:hypothetical protein